MSTLPKQQPSTPPIKQLSVDTTPSSHKSDKGKKLSNYEYAYGNNVIITDVWHENLQQEMERIIHLVEQYPFVAMDTEFPGVVVKPLGNFRNPSEYHYQTLKCNVNMLKIIQLGLTFSDGNGNFPKDGHCTWQFHFKFNLKEDMYAQDSIELLTNSGIDFKKHEERGIDIQQFGELLMSSGIVLNEEVRWISFHSAYDFGYLIKLITNANLPDTEDEFFDLLHTYFPFVYDIKYLMKSCETLKGGLNQLAEDLKIVRIGPAHQAGSDSLLTLLTFFKMMQLFFENKFDDEKYIGVLYGIGKGFYGNGSVFESQGVSTPTYNAFSPQSNTIVNDHATMNGIVYYGNNPTLS